MIGSSRRESWFDQEKIGVGLDESVLVIFWGQVRHDPVALVVLLSKISFRERGILNRPDARGRARARDTPRLSTRRVERKPTNEDGPRMSNSS